MFPWTDIFAYKIIKSKEVHMKESQHSDTHRYPCMNSSLEMIPSLSSSNFSNKFLISVIAVDQRSNNMGFPNAVSLIAAKPSGATFFTVLIHDKKISLWRSQVSSNWDSSASTNLFSSIVILHLSAEYNFHQGFEWEITKAVEMYYTHLHQNLERHTYITPNITFSSIIQNSSYSILFQRRHKSTCISILFPTTKMCEHSMFQ